MRVVNPLNDFLFKKLFGSDETKHLLISFLNAILHNTLTLPIQDVEIVENTRLTPELLADKMGELDIRALLTDNTHVNIEVQITRYNHMEKRTLWYWGRMFYQQLKKGNDYASLHRVITINILDYTFTNTTNYHKTYQLRDATNPELILTDLIEIHFIEMPTFLKMAEKDLKNNSLHRWLTFLDKRASDATIKELIMMDKHLEDAEKFMDYLTQDEETKHMYAIRERAYFDRISFEKAAREEGLQQGLQEGLEKGLEKGIAKGIQKGISEGKLTEKISTAEKLYAKGFSIEDIMEITELPRQVINESLIK